MHHKHELYKEEPGVIPVLFHIRLNRVCSNILTAIHGCNGNVSAFLFLPVSFIYFLFLYTITINIRSGKGGTLNE